MREQNPRDHAEREHCLNGEALLIAKGLADLCVERRPRTLPGRDPRTRS
jgi:hypothetical protein